MELYDNGFCCMELYDKHFWCMEVNPGSYVFYIAKIKIISEKFFRACAQLSKNGSFW